MANRALSAAPSGDDVTGAAQPAPADAAQRRNVLTSIRRIIAGITQQCSTREQKRNMEARLAIILGVPSIRERTRAHDVIADISKHSARPQARHMEARLTAMSGVSLDPLQPHHDLFAGISRHCVTQDEALIMEARLEAVASCLNNFDHDDSGNRHNANTNYYNNTNYDNDTNYYDNDYDGGGDCGGGYYDPPAEQSASHPGRTARQQSLDAWAETRPYLCVSAVQRKAMPEGACQGAACTASGVAAMIAVECHHCGKAYCRQCDAAVHRTNRGYLHERWEMVEGIKRRRVPQPDEAALWPEQVPMTSCESAQCRGHEPRWVLTDIPSGAPVKVVEQGMLFTLRHGQCTCACCNPDVCS